MARSLGKKTASMLKFRHEDTPRSAREFKRKYPAEFESLKGATGGRDFSDEMLSELRQSFQTPVEWTIVEDKYEIESAIRGLHLYLRHYANAPNVDWVRDRLAALESKDRICDEPNHVLKLCVNFGDLDITAREAQILDALSQSSGHSGHPHAEAPLYCVGWIRWCDKGDTWIVEEVQSDVMGTRRGVNEPFMRQQIRAAGLAPEEVLAVLDKVEPWHSRIYEDAIGFLLEKAAEKGVKVEMVDYSYKQDEESPRSIYTDLPRSMGMKLSEGSESAVLDKTWKIKPNRKRRTSRRKASR